MSSDPIIKAYFKRDYPEFRLLYNEVQKPVNDGSVVIVSVYKNSKDKTYCVIGTIKKNGDYTFFNDDRFHAGIYVEDEIVRSNVTSDALDKLELYVILKRKIFSTLCTDKNLPSVLSVGTTDRLTFYYLDRGILSITRVESGQLNIQLPEQELNYLSALLSKLGIYVVNLRSLGVDYLEHPRNGDNIY
jgi:hypothetical protein